jgi:hypothetical protein
MLEADELRRLLDALAGITLETGRADQEPETVTLELDPALRALILPSVIAGFGNPEVETLPRSALDLEGG